MIKRWHLRNFKSFRQLPSLTLSQINVLAGANSSGKSSIIQSILLLKQTLQYGAENRALALNGPLLRLGAFEDVRHFASRNEDLTIDVEFAFEEKELRAIPLPPWIRTLRRHATGPDSGIIRSLVLQLAYGSNDGVLPGLGHPTTPASLTPDLISSSLKTVRDVASDSERDNFYTWRRRYNQSSDSDDFGAPYSVSLDTDSRNEVFTGKPEASILGGFLSHFLPSWIAVQYNATAKAAVDLSENICSTSVSPLGSKALADRSIPDSVVDAINEWLAERDGTLIDQTGNPVSALIARRALLPFLPKARFPHLGIDPAPSPSEQVPQLDELKAKIIFAFIQNTSPTYDVELELPRGLTIATSFISDFFKEGVRYLGPLRDNPRPVYQLEALGSTTDVGYRGEHTAAVLDLNSRSFIRYHRPPADSSESDYVTTAEREWKTLHDAVVEWLTYLGVADDVVTTDAGVFGNRLQVSTDGLRQFHDLTNVGVGVSQVLPIVVMALLAPRGSFLIFEQPELHLHPKVQARLADFFIALALDGKETLLETHSEYLVDRFRLRVALSATDAVRPLINILFSERRGGESTLTPVEISEFGSVVNWPRDFFEQSQQDVGHLLQAASRKRQLRATQWDGIRIH